MLRADMMSVLYVPPEDCAGDQRDHEREPGKLMRQSPVPLRDRWIG